MAGPGEPETRTAALENAFSSALLLFEGVDSFKDKQKEVLRSFLYGKDVMALLPTSFGKSLIYQAAPAVARQMLTSPQCPDRLKTANFPIVIVLSPLVALIRDQVKEARRLGVSAVSLGDATPSEIRGVQMGRFELVFGNPETWVLTSAWRDMLKTDVYQQNLLGIVVDEAHKTPAWGEAVARGGEPFRKCFARVSELRSLCSQGTPVLALTASADLKTRKDIVRLLGMSSETTYVEARLDRTNIRLSAVRVKSTDLTCLDWVVSGLKTHGTSFDKVIIYCRSFPAVGAIYKHLVRQVGDQAYVGTKRSDHCLVAIYQSETLEEKKEHVMSSFVLSCSVARVIVATTSLSMGINFPDVRYIVMYEPPANMEDLLQQLGRAGRTGQQSHAVVYTYSVQRCDKQVAQYVRTDKCLRTTLYHRFEREPTTKPFSPGHLCCSVCHRSCTCGSGSDCKEPVPVSDSVGGVKTEQRWLTRSVDQRQKDVLREALYEYRDSLVQEKKLLVSVDLTTGFTLDLIESVVEECPYIFDAKYVYDNIESVCTTDQARIIADIVKKVFDDGSDIDTMIDYIQQEFVKNTQVSTGHEQLVTSSSGSSSENDSDDDGIVDDDDDSGDDDDDSGNDYDDSGDDYDDDDDDEDDEEELVV
ncbi:ATP-dependent DNA helicase RecQ-like [Branchiostoma floridae x Branchiostoma japonicum]